MKTQNTNKGITLIALVITIIVMLILVGVTISMAVNGGLFEYAGRAASETNRAMANEKELANLDVDMTVDEMIDKYTGATKGVDPNLLNIGDYVNYPVAYTNVPAGGNASLVSNSQLPRDEFTGWRVLAKETDEKGKVLYVKLISAGVPLNFKMGMQFNCEEGIKALTTNFLTTEITSEMTDFKFYNSGFNYVTGGNLTATFSNKYTEGVRSLTKDDLDVAITSFGGPYDNTNYYCNDPAYLDLLAVPLKTPSSETTCFTWLATKSPYSSFDPYAVSPSGLLDLYPIEESMVVVRGC